MTLIQKLWSNMVELSDHLKVPISNPRRHLGIYVELDFEWNSQSLK